MLCRAALTNHQTKQNKLKIQQQIMAKMHLWLLRILQIHAQVYYRQMNQPIRQDKMSLDMRKPVFCICENKDTDQLRGNREADQRLCFRYTDSTIPLRSKSEISSLYLSSVALQPGLCRTWSKTRKTDFLTTRLKYKAYAEAETYRVFRQNHHTWQHLF